MSHFRLFSTVCFLSPGFITFGILIVNNFCLWFGIHDFGCFCAGASGGGVNGGGGTNVGGGYGAVSHGAASYGAVSHGAASNGAVSNSVSTKGCKNGVGGNLLL